LLQNTEEENKKEAKEEAKKKVESDAKAKKLQEEIDLAKEVKKERLANEIVFDLTLPSSYPFRTFGKLPHH